MSIGDWQPLWIGEESRKLYAALHVPSAPCAQAAVLLVSPLLHEQPRSRRFLTETASELASLGIPVLRFDFFGTADSAGDNIETDLSSMRDDLARAMDALRKQSGVARVVLLAWRAGALAAWDWMLREGDASVLVLWEPILSGAEWLAELSAADLRERCSPDRYTFVLPREVDNADGQLMGYAVSTRFRDEFAAIDMRASDTRPGCPVWLIERDGQPLEAMVRDRTISLPADAPSFAGSARMDVSLFMSPRMEQLVRAIGQALMESA